MSRRGIIRFSSLLLLLLSVGCAPTLPGPSGKIVKNYAGIRTAEAVGPEGEEYRKTVAQMDPYLARLFLGTNDFDLVDGIFVRLSGIADDGHPETLELLPRPQRIVFELWGAGGIMGNGGFQYLFESAITNFNPIAESYDAIGASESAQAVRDALTLFPNSQPHSDINERLSYLKSLGADGKQRLEACDDAIFDDNRATKRKLAAYVRANAAAFVSLPSNKWEKLEELERKDLPAPHANISDEAFELWLRSIDAGASIEGYSQIVPQTKSKVFASEFKVSSRRLSLSEYRSSTDAELEILAGLEPRKTIHKLSLHDTCVTRKGIVFIPQFPELTSLDLTGTNAEDGWCSELGKLSKLEHLVISGAKITDAGMAHLAPLSKMSSLVLVSTSVTGDGLRQLVSLPLKHISLRMSKSQVADRGMEVLAGFEQLESLDFYQGNYGDETLRHVGHCARLKRLELEKTAVTDDGMKHLANLHQLEYLTLYGTAVSDAGLEPLGGLPKLERLSLSETRVTDAGLKHLASLPSLAKLSLIDTGVKGTDELGQLDEVKSLRTLSLPKGTEGSPGVRILRERRPELEISFY